MPDQRPNILIIMSDQHSKHMLGCYGNSIVRTPNLDRLASEGQQFNNAYCPSPLCVPSRMSFMTGRIPFLNRVWDNAHILSSAIPCWTHSLGAAGYETALIGRMHFVGADQRHGFEKRPIGEFSACHPGTPLDWGKAYTKVPSEGCSRTRTAAEIAGSGTTLHDWFDTRVTEATSTYLSEKAADSDRRPFAAVAGFVHPHNPYVAPKELLEYYLERVDVPDVEESQPETIRRQREKCDVLDPPVPEERVRLARAAYFALCDLFDSRVGEILATLDETGLADNTLVIYCSDHGEMAGEHGLWAKSNYYEASASVPMIARLPGAIEAGSSTDAVCNLYDLGPTMADVAGAEPMRAVNGASLWPVMQGGSLDEWDQETFSELADLKQWPRGLNDPEDDYYPSRMIRSGPWKLWVDADEADLPPALFNLDDDPEELNDLADDPAHRETRDRLLAAVMQDWDPDVVRCESRDLNASREVLKAWAKAVNPDAPDLLLPPKDGIEEDIELV